MFNLIKDFDLMHFTLREKYPNTGTTVFGHFSRSVTLAVEDIKTLQI